ncbi:MAG: ethylbenzene dehydrogenase-related protein [Anaerolineales bacterium]
MSRRLPARTLQLLLPVALGVGLMMDADRAGRASAFAQGSIDGQTVYLERCAFCHGENGDGNGPVARYLSPRPRDFTLGQFRFRTTPSGDLPLRDDVIAIVKSGVRGTAMPRWEGVLSDSEVEAVVDYLTTSFVPFWGTYEPPVIEIPDPPRVTAAMVESGALQFQELQCWKCHGDQGRGNGPSAPTLTDETDRPIRPADLTKAWRYKGGSDLVSIYTRFSTGMDGSPMPSFYDVTSEEGRWALAAYVQSLQSGEPTEESVLQAAFVSEDLPTNPDNPLWDQADPTSYFLTGQVIVGPRWQTPSVDAVTVRALYNSADLGLLVEWNDPVEDNQSSDSEVLSDAATYIDLETFPRDAGPFADGLAVQFPAQVAEGVRKPYFAWGQPGNPVNLWVWRAGDQVREFNATGLKTEPASQANTNVAATATWADGRYRLIVIRPLASGDPEDVTIQPGHFIPIAFQAWDGSKGESGTRLSLSSWNNLVLEEPTPITAYLYGGLAVLLVGAGEWWLYRRVRS